MGDAERNTQHAARSTQHAPRVSVIIPVRDGGANFRRCLDAIRACDPPPDEVIVVDDGSTDDTARVAQAWGARVLSTAQPASGPAQARNLGARAASGQVVLFVDADVAIHPDAIGRVARHFAYDPELAACFGSYDDAPAAPNFLSQYKNLFHHYVHQSARADASTFWAGCGAIRRDVFLSAGGFSQHYDRPAIEDIELGYRLRAAGHRLRLDKALQGKHLKRWTWRSLLRSDIFDRGVPWTELILRDGAFLDDLNLQTHNRVSVVLVYLLLASFAAGMLGWIVGWMVGWMVSWMVGWLAAGGLAIALLALNLPLYRFFARQRSWFFALRAIPVHWLYYGYNGVSFTIGLIRHFISGRVSVGSSHVGVSRCVGVVSRRRFNTQMPPTTAILILILLIAAGFRFANLGRDSFWYDELLQVDIAAQDIPTLLSKLGEHAAVPLDYFVTHAVLKLGRNEFLLRFPAAFWGMLALPLVYQIGRRLFGPAVGVGAALLLALSGFHIFYSHEMRPYALLTFLAALSFYWLVRVFQERRNRYWLGYSLTIAAGALTHYFMLFVIAAQGLIVLGGWLAAWATTHRATARGATARGATARRATAKRATARGRPYVGFGLALMPTVLALALTPWFGSVLDVGRLFVTSIVAPDAIPPESALGDARGGATPLDLAFFRERLLGGLSGGGPVLPIVFLILLLAGMWFGLRRQRGQTSLTLTWAFVPAALTIAFLYHRGTFFALRYILFSLPALLMLVALGAIAVGQAMYRLRSGYHTSRITYHMLHIAPLVVAGAALVLLGFTWHQADASAFSPRENWREAGRFLVNSVRPDDVVIAPQRADIVYFYAPLPPTQIRPSVLPDDLSKQPAASQRLWLITSKYLYPPQAYHSWISLRPHVEYRVDDAVQVFLVEPAGDKASLLQDARSIRPPETWPAWATLADQYEVAGEVESAVAHYRRAITLADSPERTISLTLRLGDVLRRARRLDEAALEYRRALSLDPCSVDSLANLGRVYLEQGQLDEARVHLLQAVAIDPQSYAANLFLADVYQRQGQFDRATSHYALAQEIVPELITPP